MDETKAAWIAGIIEGEGHIGWCTSTRCPRIRVAMSDLDVLERLKEWSGVGVISDFRPASDTRKQLWQWNVRAQRDFLALAAAIKPFLLERRAAKLQEVLDQYEAYRAEVGPLRRQRAPR